MTERIDEYLDGLLSPAEAARVEDALRRDPALRAELEAARRFRAVLEALPPARGGDAQHAFAAVVHRRRRRGVLVRLGLAAAAAAAALLALPLLRPESPRPPDPLSHPGSEAWHEFGRRLGAMAAQRREQRLPRIGLADLEPPPALAMGVVFEAALGELGVPVPAGAAVPVRAAVQDHFVALDAMPDTLDGECRRAAAELAFYRRLRSLAGTDVADAYYDVFRPGLADLATARRVPRGTLVRAVPGDAYLREYEATLARLRRWYGDAKVRVVLGRLAPGDRREVFRDAAQDGVGRDAVLTMRAHLYRAASEAGADRLYVDVG